MDRWSFVSEMQIEEILRKYSQCREGREIVLPYTKFIMVCKEIKELADSYVPRQDKALLAEAVKEIAKEYDNAVADWDYKCGLGKAISILKSMAGEGENGNLKI